MSQIVDGLLPNLIVNPSQQNVAGHREIFPAKIPSIPGTEKPKVTVSPYSRPNPISDVRQNPAVDSCKTTERIVPVFSSKFRSTIPRGTSDKPPPSSVASQPLAATSTNSSQPGGTFKPTFSQGSGFQKRPGTNASAKPSAKPNSSKLIGAAQKNAANVGASRPKESTQNSLKSTNLSGGLGDRAKIPTPKCAASQFSASAASRNADTCENGFRLSGLPLSGTVSLAQSQQTTFQGSIARSPAAVPASSGFSVCGEVDLTLGFTGKQQPASLNKHARDEHVRRPAGDCAGKAKERPDCQKRKMEVGAVP